MGIRVSRWVTSFGFALNLEGDHGPSQYIRPCGLDGVELTTLEEILGQAPSRSSLVEAVRESFVSTFDRSLDTLSTDLLYHIGMSAGLSGTPEHAISHESSGGFT
jgi:lipoate-protein ligase B